MKLYQATLFSFVLITSFALADVENSQWITTWSASPQKVWNIDFVFPTLIPEQDVTWKPVTVPTTYVNTSGTITNQNNKAMIGTSLHGSAVPHQRRSTPDPLSVAPSIPPYLTPNPL